MSDFSKDQLAHFSPGDPRYRGKLWVRVVAPDHIWYHVFWSRLALALLALALVAYLALAGAAWAFMKYQRGFDAVTYADLVFYPLRKADLNHRRGLFHIARGQAELEGGKDYRLAYGHLATGVALAPEDVSGRRLLAYLQLRFGLMDQALATLAAGVRLAHDDLAYLKILFGLLLEAQQDTRVLALAQEMLPAQPDEQLTHQFVAVQAATAYYQRGRYDACEKIISTWRLERSLEGQLLLAKCDWERGYPETALLRLQHQIATFPARDELYLQLIKFNRDLGRQDEARRLSLLRIFRDPASPGASADLLYAYYAADDRVAVQREIEAYLHAHAADSSAHIILAWFAADTAQPALARRLLALARTRGYPVTSFNLALVQSLLNAQDYAAALAAADTARSEDHEEIQHVPSFLDGQRALALFGLHRTDQAVGALESFLGQSHLRATDALLLSRQLRLLNAPTSARRVLDTTFRLDSQNQAVLTELVRLDATLLRRDELAAELPALLQMRKPARTALEEAVLALDRPGDAALRASLRTTIARLTTTPAPE